MYGSVLKFLYENGLNVFYEKPIDELPMELIKSILNNDQKLKKKYDMDDFMTSLMIWRELQPGNSRGHKFPIPPCNLLIPLEHSQWNASMHGSDTGSKLCSNNKAILPIKSPQCKVVSRLLQLYAVLLHRTRHAVTGKKKVDPLTDTIKTVRDRNNKRISFTNSLNFVSSRLSAKTKTPTTIAAAAKKGKKMNAPRKTRNNKKSRHATDHTIVGERTGLTPIGRGKNLSSELHPKIALRQSTCTGTPVKIFTEQDDESKKLSRHKCFLCEQTGVSWWCPQCKQVLCVQEDRTEKIHKLLKGKKGDDLRRRYPSLAENDDEPPFYYEVGYKINGKPIFAGISCFQIAHRVINCENEGTGSPAKKRSRLPLESIDEDSPQTPLR